MSERAPSAERAGMLSRALVGGDARRAGRVVLIRGLSFRTQAGCASNSSGNSGSSMVTTPAADVKRRGAAMAFADDPSPMTLALRLVDGLPCRNPASWPKAVGQWTGRRLYRPNPEQRRNYQSGRNLL